MEPPQSKEPLFLTVRITGLDPETAKYVRDELNRRVHSKHIEIVICSATNGETLNPNVEVVSNNGPYSCQDITYLVERILADSAGTEHDLSGRRVVHSSTVTIMTADRSRYAPIACPSESKEA